MGQAELLCAAVHVRPDNIDSSTSVVFGSLENTDGVHRPTF